MSNIYGRSIKVSIFGESHGAGIGVVIDGVEPGLSLDMEEVRRQMARRAPGGSLSTTRKEADQVEILSGIRNDVTCGTPICGVIYNQNTRSKDYDKTRSLLRPSHADYTGHVKYRGYEDYRGGGHFSGRITAPLVFAGAICRQALEARGIQIGSHIVKLYVIEERRFAQEDLPVTLSLSLHAPNDDVRKKLMPVARKYGMDDVLDACRYYIEKTGRRVIFEYALVHGVNADPAQAVELAGRLRGMQCHVNLIPLNSVPERGLTGVTEREVDAFKHVLEQKGISVTRRREMGDDIEGACGQLRRRYIKDNNLNSET